MCPQSFGRERLLPHDPSRPFPALQPCLHILVSCPCPHVGRSDVASVPGTGDFPEQPLVSVYLCDVPLCGHRWNVLALPRNQPGSLSSSRNSLGTEEPRLAVPCVYTKELFLKPKSF